MLEAERGERHDEMTPEERAALGRAGALAFGAVTRTFPHHLVQLVNEPGELGDPRALYPTFSGAFDWHSAVHGHWTLVRVLRLAPDLAPEGAAAFLAGNLTPANVAADVRYFESPGHEGFERPYGLAWLLQLAAELREWDAAESRAWLAALAPLERIAADRLARWLPRLAHPIRGGEHPQTAFAMALALDWARLVGDAPLERVLTDSALRFYGHDLEGPIAYEPSAHDFLSPVLAEADLMRRILAPLDFPDWLRGFLPKLDSPAAARWFEPVQAVDREDGKFAHFDGLNASRAWMLDGVVAALDPSAPVAAIFARAARAHRAAALAGFDTGHYAGSHWLGSFVAYLVTRRGLREGG